MTRKCFVNLNLIALLAILSGLASGHAQSYGLTDRPPIGPFLDDVLPEAAPVLSTNWSIVPAFPNLVFTNAVGITHVPDTNLMCVWEREGRVWFFPTNAATTQKWLVLDLSYQCQGWDDSGLLGLAFHPGFETNRYLFCYYTWVTPGTVAGNPTTRPPHTVTGKYHDRLSRFTCDAVGVTSTNTEVVFVDQTGNDTWHNGGGLFFHPTNGFLYWTDGDDENSANRQVITRGLFSGVFRIDVDMQGGSISHPPPRQPDLGFTSNYYIPNDNPFVGQPNVLEEFFCLGLRSPHRMTIDPPTGRIYIGDVGQGSREEIDRMEPGEDGLNFQWDYQEGFLGSMPASYVGISKPPILDYTHGEGQAVIGGYVYRGSEFAPELGGRYIFGDNVSRIIWVMDEGTTPATKMAIGTLPKGDGPNSGSDYTGLSSFGLDANNEIYMCQMSSVGGRIYRLSSGAPVANRPMPALLSQTGTFTDLAALTPRTGLIPYSVNSPLWSDNAYKTRWLAVPTNTLVTFSPTGSWTFPVGTVLVKHFELSTNDTNPNYRKRLETRLLVRGTNGLFYGASYKWREDNSDADLVPTLTNENVVVTTASGTRTQVWSYPGRQDCLTCHTIPSSGVLGVNTRQLNGDFAYPQSHVTDNQIRSLNHVGLFSSTLGEAAIPGYARMVAVTDTSAILEDRVRSYLDANCSQCHRPNGSVNALFDARYDTVLTNQGIVGGAVLNNLGIGGAKVITPADLATSVLYQRANSLGSIQMPPLAKNTIDSNAMAVLAEWINSLPPLPVNLPLPWVQTDVGAVGFPGDGNSVGGAFTVMASGTDIWDNTDAFHLVHRLLTGDGQIVARVTSVQNTDPWTKAGVMFRESLTGGSKHAFMALTPGNGAAFQRRAMTDGASDHTPEDAVTAPYWVRLVRAGNTFTGYTSADGNSWATVGTATITMASTVYVGLAVTAHNNSVLNTSTFDNVSVVSANNPPPTVVLTSPLDGAAIQSGTDITLTATANDTDGGVAKVEFFRDTIKLGEDTTNPYSLVWSHAPLDASILRVVATDYFGAAATSGPVNITVTAPPPVTIRGTVWYAPVEYPASEPSSKVVGGVTLNLTGGWSAGTTSGSDGLYSVTGIPYGGDYEVGPIKSDDSPTANGVTTLDIALIRQHILTPGSSSLTTPYKLLAADVNGSGDITTLDIALIRQLILGGSTAFPAGLWRFVPTNHVFSNPSSPWSAPGSLAYPNLVSDVSGADFVGIKLGDVNDSWSPPAGASSLGANGVTALGAVPGSEVVIGVGEGSGVLGELVSVPVRVSGFKDVTSVQFTLSWDAAVLRYAGVGEYGLSGMSAGSFGTTRSGEGKLTFLWYGAGVALADGTALFTVDFEVVGEAGRVTSLALGDSPTLREASVNLALAGMSTQEGSVNVVAPGGPRMGNPVYREGVFELSVATVTGQSYVLEYSERLPATNWMALPAIKGDGTMMILADPSATNHQRFYRVRVE